MGKIFVKHLKRISYPSDTAGRSSCREAAILQQMKSLISFKDFTVPELHKLLTAFSKSENIYFPEYLSMVASSNSQNSDHWDFRIITTAAELIGTWMESLTPYSTLNQNCEKKQLSSFTLKLLQLKCLPDQNFPSFSNPDYLTIFNS